jgi:hypothetical protein
MPTSVERKRDDIPEGVPVLVITTDTEVRVYPGDRTALSTDQGPDPAE